MKIKAEKKGDTIRLIFSEDRFSHVEIIRFSHATKAIARDKNDLKNDLSRQLTKAIRNGRFFLDVDKAKKGTSVDFFMASLVNESMK